jgi:hypothetical protein
MMPITQLSQPRHLQDFVVQPAMGCFDRSVQLQPVKERNPQGSEGL